MAIVGGECVPEPVLEVMDDSEEQRRYQRSRDSDRGSESDQTQVLLAVLGRALRGRALLRRGHPVTVEGSRAPRSTAGGQQDHAGKGKRERGNVLGTENAAKAAMTTVITPTQGSTMR
jgi:hypothetical protein